MYSILLGIAASNFRFGGGFCFFGRVAKICRVRPETFLQRKKPGSIDTFRASMLKYNETKCTNKGDADMLSKMNAKLENQFAAFFAVGSVFPFLRDSNFSI
jgi:hypothetical protein